jgi:uncharacterized damage-inducible protein DinB
MSTAARTRVDDLLDVHRDAVHEFFTRAAQVSPARWDVPRAPGKWSPAQEVKHIVLSYEAFTRDLGGGEPMKLVGTRWKRLLWRVLGLTSILWLKRLPKGARAPREARPPEGAIDQETLLAELRARTDEFEIVFREAWETAPARKLTHPYFGGLTLTDALELARVHTRHHAAVLPPPGARQQVGA